MSLQRKMNYTPAERRLLADLAKQQPDLTLPTKDAMTKKRKQDAWEEITMIFNENASSTVYRSTTELKNCLQNILQRSKKRGPYKARTFCNVSRMRKTNFTHFERKLLLSLAKNHPVLHSSHKDNVTQMGKRKAWSVILWAFNKNPNVTTQRSAPELKTCLQNLLRRSHEKEVQEIRQIKGKDAIPLNHVPTEVTILKTEDIMAQSFQPVQVESFDPTQGSYEENQVLNDHNQSETYTLIQESDDPVQENSHDDAREPNDTICITVHRDEAASMEPPRSQTPLAHTAYMQTPQVMTSIHTNGPSQSAPSRLIPNVVQQKEKLGRMKQRLVQEEHDLRLSIMREEHGWKLEEHNWRRQEHELRMSMIRINSRF